MDLKMSAARSYSPPGKSSPLTDNNITGIINHPHDSYMESASPNKSPEKRMETNTPRVVDNKIGSFSQECDSHYPQYVPHVIHIAKDSLAVHTSYDEIRAIQDLDEEQPLSSTPTNHANSSLTNEDVLVVHERTLANTRVQFHVDCIKEERISNDKTHPINTSVSAEVIVPQETTCNLQGQNTKLKNHRSGCKCVKCTKKSQNKHEKSHPKNFQCGQCNLSFTASAFLVKHTKIHKEREKTSTKVKEGGQSFVKQREGVEHEGTGMNGSALQQGQEQIIESNRECEICHKTFVDSTVLACHLRMHSHQMKHPQHCETISEGNEIQNDCTSTCTKDLAAQQQGFNCELCNKQFSNSGLLTNHRRRHSSERPFHCSHCDKGFIFAGDLTKHIRCHTGEKPFLCSECGMKFALSGNLKKHMDSHNNVRPFQCKICEKSFRRAAHLTVHARTHSGEKPFYCNVCDKSFSRETGLVMHQKIHLGQKSIQCQHCEKAFYCKSDLTKHQRTHTGEKPYKCEHCQKGFSQLGHLKIHRRTHTGEKPFHCSFCTSSFSSSQNLGKHKRKHTGLKPFECNQCERKFAQKGNLQTHLRVHSDERPFKCNECETSFKDPSSLAKHKKQLHTTVRPYVCTVCMKAFKRGSHLKKHKESVHKETKPEMTDNNNINNATVDHL